MYKLIFDGEEEQRLDTAALQQLGLAKVIELYQSTVIYLQEAKKLAAGSESCALEWKAAFIKCGLNALIERLTAELGETKTLLLIAEVDLMIKLCE